MKKIILSFFCFWAVGASYAQKVSFLLFFLGLFVLKNEVLGQTDSSKTNVIDNVKFNFGLGIGYNVNTANTYDAVLSPTDKKLRRQLLDNRTFVISSVAVMDLPFFRIRKRPIAAVLSLNIGELTPNGNFSFNKKIDGGLGGAYRLLDNFYMGAFLEFTNHRQLRDYIVEEFDNKPIVIRKETNSLDGAGNPVVITETLTALDDKDNTLFYTKTTLSISFKLIYAFGKN